MLQHYILEGKTVKPVPFMEWANWGMEWSEAILNEKTTVKKTTLPDGVFISTIFLGMPNSIFETMIFGGEHDGYHEQYATWEEAEAGHQQAIELIYNV